MKSFKFLLLSVFLVLFSGSAYAMNFAIDVNSDGDLDMSYDVSISERGYGLVNLDFNNTGDGVIQGLSLGTASSGSLSGSFEEAAGGYLNIRDAVETNTELTYIFDTEGTFTVDYVWDGAGNLSFDNHAFDFTSGQFTVYQDNNADWNFASQPNLETDDNLFGSSDGTPVATFTLNGGSGTLQDTPGAIDNVDTWSLSSALTAGIFYAEGDVDFATLADNISIFIEMITNSTNDQVNPLSTLELADAYELGLLTNQNPDFTLEVTTDGTVKFNVVPEPGTLMLLGFGLLGFAGIGRRKINR